MLKTIRLAAESRRSFLPVLVLVAVYLVSVAVVVGQGAQPMVDEWIYIDAARQFAETGRIDIAPISFAAAVFEAIYGGAVLVTFGGSTTTLVLATALLAGLAGIAFWDLLTRSGVGSGMAFVVVGSFLFSAVFYGLTTTYMTDTHAVSLVVISAALYSRGIDQEARGNYWLLAGSCTASAAYLSRPGALGVVAGVVLVSSQRKRSALVWALTMPVITVATHLAADALGAFPAVRSDIIGRLALPAMSTVRDVVFVTAISIGIWLVPLAPAIVWSVLRRKRCALTALVVSPVILIFLWISGDPPVIGNWLNPTGMYPIDESTVGQRPWLIGWSAYFAIVATASLIAVSGLIVSFGSQVKPRLTSAEIGLWASAFLSLVLVFFTQVATLDLILDRYFVVLLPAVLFSVAVRGELGKSHRVRPIGGILLLFSAVLTVILAVDGMRVQNAIFLTAESALSRGIEADEIDGGAAWTGFMFGLDLKPEETVYTEEWYWWRGRFAPGIDPQYVVTLNPRAPACVLFAVDVETFIGPGNRIGLVNTAC